MTKPADLTGRRFERLIATSRVDNSRSGKARWLCHCDCGQMTVVAAERLISGNTRSCGCLHRERAAERLRRLKFRHGLGQTRAYATWSRMMARCFDPKNEKFNDYGGRGITVCERWLKFEKFYEDMGERPLGLTLDRKDNSGGYGPSNCRWATPKQQANNTRRNRRLTADGQTLTLTEWSQRLGVTPSTLHERIAKHGVEQALSGRKQGA